MSRKCLDHKLRLNNYRKNNTIMKKLFLFCTLCAAMLTAHATVYSDTHGDFSWTLDTETGILEFFR